MQLSEKNVWDRRGKAFWSVYFLLHWFKEWQLPPNWNEFHCHNKSRTKNGSRLSMEPTGNDYWKDALQGRCHVALRLPNYSLRLLLVLISVMRTIHYFSRRWKFQGLLQPLWSAPVLSWGPLVNPWGIITQWKHRNGANHTLISKRHESTTEIHQAL